MGEFRYERPALPEHAYAFCSGDNPKRLGKPATYIGELHRGATSRLPLNLTALFGSAPDQRA
jgi:hypothetical protein